MKSVPLRHLADLNPSTPEFDRVPADEQVVFLPLETVWSDSRADHNRLATKSDVASGYTRFRAGDVVCPKVTPTFQAGRSMVTQSVGAGTTELHVLRPREGVDARWLCYAVRSKHFLDEGVTAFQGVAGLQRVPPEFVNSFRVADYAPEEQRRIGDFLDDRVSRIDRIIAARRKQSDSLSQLARARLQASVSELVEQYAHTRLGRISKIRSGSFLPSEQFIEDGPFEVVGGNGVAGWFESTNVRAGTIAVGRVGALCGNVHLLTRDAWLTDNALGVELTDGLVEPEFLAAVLDSLNLNSLASQTAQPLLTGAQVADQPIPVGMTTEQTANVVKAWEALRSEAHMGLLQHSIDLLTEYKSALITAAVTGELDVSTAGSSIPG